MIPGPSRWGVVARCWLGFAALGAGMLHVALAIGSPPGLAVALIAVGGAEFLWGVLALGTGRVPVPGVTLIAALVPIAGWVVVLVVSGSLAVGPLTGALRIFPMLVASLLDAVLALGIAVGIRGGGARDPRTPRARLIAVAAGAAAVAVLVLPALAATEAGDRIPAPLPGHPDPGH